MAGQVDVLWRRQLAAIEPLTKFAVRQALRLPFEFEYKERTKADRNHIRATSANMAGFILMEACTGISDPRKRQAVKSIMRKLPAEIRDLSPDALEERVRQMGGMETVEDLYQAYRKLAKKYRFIQRMPECQRVVSHVLDIWAQNGKLTPAEAATAHSRMSNIYHVLYNGLRDAAHCLNRMRDAPG